MSTTSSDTTTAIEREIAIAARPETVWEFFVDPRRRAGGWARRRSSTAAGGIYRVEVIPGNVARGVLRRARPAAAARLHVGLRGRAGSPVPPGSTTIEIDLVPDGDARRSHFTHRDLPTDDAAVEACARLGPLPRAPPDGRGRGDPGADPWLSGSMS